MELLCSFWFCSRLCSRILQSIVIGSYHAHFVSRYYRYVISSWLRRNLIGRQILVRISNSIQLVRLRCYLRILHRSFLPD